MLECSYRTHANNGRPKKSSKKIIFKAFLCANLQAQTKIFDFELQLQLLLARLR